MGDNIIRWPDYEAWEAWVTPRRKRLGKPTERGTILWFPPVHPIYAVARERAMQSKIKKGIKQ